MDYLLDELDPSSLNACHRARSYCRILVLTFDFFEYLLTCSLRFASFCVFDKEARPIFEWFCGDEKYDVSEIEF